MNPINAKSVQLIELHAFAYRLLSVYLSESFDFLKKRIMNKRIDIPSELYEDEVVCFLADRYHTTPRKVVQCFLAQTGCTPDEEITLSDFRLEDNEMEILRGLTRVHHS